MPRRKPINRMIKIAIIVTTNPITPLTIFFLELSIAALSPPAVIIPIAPKIKVKTNQIMAMMVIRPIAEEMKLANVPIAFSPGFPSGPNPLRGPKLSCASSFIA